MVKPLVQTQKLRLEKGGWLVEDSTRIQIKKRLTSKPKGCHTFGSYAASGKAGRHSFIPLWPHNKEALGGKHGSPFWPAAAKNPSLEEVLKGHRNKAMKDKRRDGRE